MPDSAPTFSWKFASAALVVAVTVGVCWFVQKRSQPPPPPPVTLPYPTPDK
jgi:hypothetical protein